MESTVTSKGRVHQYLSESRIGRALLRIYNQDHGTTFTLQDVRFIAFKGDDGCGHVAMLVNGDREESRIGQLYLILGSDVSAAEVAFFQGLNIGYK